MDYLKKRHSSWYTASVFVVVVVVCMMVILESLHNEARQLHWHSHEKTKHWQQQLKNNTSCTCIRQSDVYLNSLWERYNQPGDGEEMIESLQKINSEISKRIMREQQQQPPSFENATICWSGDAFFSMREGDVELMSLWSSYVLNADGQKREAILRELYEQISFRARVESDLEKIGAHLFGPEAATTLMRKDSGDAAPHHGCIPQLKQVYEKYCGKLRTFYTPFPTFHFKFLVNICLNDVSEARMERAAQAVCGE